MAPSRKVADDWAAIALVSLAGVVAALRFLRKKSDESAARTGDTVRSVTNELAVAQLTSEQSRKASLESRGITLVTSSGTLVTLLLALGAIGTKAENLRLNLATVVLVLAALAFFGISAAAGIWINLPRSYTAVRTYTDGDNKEAADNGIELKGREPGLDYYLTEKNYWLPRREVERKFAIYRVAELGTARKANNAKAYALMTGIAAEVPAVFLVAAAVAFILLGRAGA